MACSAIRSPLLRNQSIRHYAAAAAQAAPSSKADIKILPNRLAIAAIDQQEPIAQVSLIFKAGSRDETYETQGISHMLRFCSGLTTTRTSGFLITRNIQQLGGEVTTTSDRETTCFTLKITKNNLEKAFGFFEDLALRPEFRPWEIEDELSRLRYEVSTVPMNVRLIEILYKAAYKNGYGYSLYCPKRQIGKIHSETLSYFVKNKFTAPKCALVTSGISMSQAESLATGIQLGTDDSKSTPSKYRGGEQRKDRASELAHVAVAVEGVPFTQLNEVLAAAVLQKIAGDGPRVKWGNDNGALAKAIGSGAVNPFAAVGLNASHSDTGLFGIMISGQAADAGVLVKGGVNWLKNPKFTDDDVKRGKAMLKSCVLASGDESVPNHISATQQVLFNRNFVSAQGIAEAIDNVSSSDIRKIADKVSKGKLSMASIGNLKNVPYLDEL